MTTRLLAMLAIVFACASPFATLGAIRAIKSDRHHVVAVDAANAASVPCEPAPSRCGTGFNI